jgi:hypothetical protein
LTRALRTNSSSSLRGNRNNVGMASIGGSGMGRGRQQSVALAAKSCVPQFALNNLNRFDPTMKQRQTEAVERKLCESRVPKVLCSN